MASASIMLKPMVQSSSLAAPQNQGAGLLAGGATSGNDFNSWMNQARTNTAEPSRSSDVNLPPEGRELPNPSRSSESSKDEVKARADISSDRTDSADSSGTQTTDSDEVSQSTSANEQSESGEQSSGDSSQAAESTTEDTDQVDVDELVDESLVIQTGSTSTETETETESAEPEVVAEEVVSTEDADAVEEPVLLDEASTDESPDVARADSGRSESVRNDSGRNEAARENQGGGIGNQGTPPGFERASDRALERAQAFNRGADQQQPPVADTEAPVVDQPQTPVEGEIVDAAPQDPALDIDTSAPPEVVVDADLSEAEAEVSAGTQTQGAGGDGAESLIDTLAAEDSAETSPVTDEIVSNDTFTLSDPELGPVGTESQAGTEDPNLEVSTVAAPTDPSLTVSEVDLASSGVSASVNPQPVVAPINSSTQQATAQTTTADAAQAPRPQPMMSAQAGSSDTGDTGQQSQNRSGIAADSAPQESRTATQIGTTASSFATEMNRLGATQVEPIYQRAYERMQQPNWGQQLGQRAIMMAQQGPRTALVRLDPPELGSLQVRVHIQAGDQVSVTFTAPNANVRDVLEQHLPRLREMFAEQGLNLAQSDVRDQSSGEKGAREGSGSSQGAGYGLSDEANAEVQSVMAAVGLVDYHV